MRRIGRPECLAFIFYTEDYGKGKVTVDGKGNPLSTPKEYPQNREELIMRVNDVFSPHGIMIGLHDDNPPDKDHEHWFLGFENNRLQPNDFEPLASQMGFRVSPKDVYVNRPDTLDDYIKHTSDAAIKDMKKEYDASHIWKSEYWNPAFYMNQDQKRDLKREQRQIETSQMDVTIIGFIERNGICYFPELLDHLKALPALYNYVLMQRSSFYFSYLRELRECYKEFGNPYLRKKYPDGSNSKDGEPYRPKSEPVKASFSETQALLRKSTDEIFGTLPESETEPCVENENADTIYAREEAPEHEQPAPSAEGASREAREADTSVTPGINESDIADADFASDDFESFNPDDDDPFHAELDTIDQAWDLGFIASSDGDNPFE